MSQIIIIILRDRVGSNITGDTDWNTLSCGFGKDKDRLFLKLKSLEMKDKVIMYQPSASLPIYYLQTGMYCSYYRPHSLVKRALFEK